MLMKNNCSREQKPKEIPLKKPRERATQGKQKRGGWGRGGVDRKKQKRVQRKLQQKVQRRFMMSSTEQDVASPAAAVPGRARATTESHDAGEAQGSSAAVRRQ